MSLQYLPPCQDVINGKLVIGIEVRCHLSGSLLVVATTILQETFSNETIYRR